MTIVPGRQTTPTPLSLDRSVDRWMNWTDSPHGGDGPGLHGLKGKTIEVKAEDAHKDKDFNAADLEECTVKM